MKQLSCYFLFFCVSSVFSLAILKTLVFTLHCKNVANIKRYKAIINRVDISISAKGYKKEYASRQKPIRVFVVMVTVWVKQEGQCTSLLYFFLLLNNYFFILTLQTTCNKTHIWQAFTVFCHQICKVCMRTSICLIHLVVCGKALGLFGSIYINKILI